MNPTTAKPSISDFPQQPRDLIERMIDLGWRCEVRDGVAHLDRHGIEVTVSDRFLTGPRRVPYRVVQ